MELLGIAAGFPHEFGTTSGSDASNYVYTTVTVGRRRCAAAGFKAAGTDYLSAWFAQTPYQLVMVQFGTNEGNAKPFDAAAYQATLRESVQSLRQVFPQAACVLIAPGDRGVLVRRSEKWKRLPASAHALADKKPAKGSAKSKSKKSAHGGARPSATPGEAPSGKVKAKRRHQTAVAAADNALPSSLSFTFSNFLRKDSAYLPACFRSVAIAPTAFLTSSW